MTSEVREATSISTRETSATAFQLAYALVLVGAGLLAAVALLYGVTHSQSSGGGLWAVVGLVSYLAVWGWAILLAMSYQPAG